MNLIVFSSCSQVLWTWNRTVIIIQFEEERKRLKNIKPQDPVGSYINVNIYVIGVPEEERQIARKKIFEDNGQMIPQET